MEIDRRLSELPDIVDVAFIKEERRKIFFEVMGENNNGYAKTYGLGVKVPRSSAERAPLAEEQAKTRKLEEELKIVNEKLSNSDESLKKSREKINFLEPTLLKFIGKEKGMPVDNELNQEHGDQEYTEEDNM